MAAQAETVVLVHGLWLRGVSMLRVKRGMARRGYRAMSYSYPTVRCDLTANAERLVRFCEGQPPGRIHLVGQSMGGIVALAAARALPRERLGRVVTIGTPYADCYSARRIQRLPGGRRILGRCMGEWLAAPRPESLADYDVGVIAGVGALGLGRVFVPSLPRPNDGVVRVEETRVPGMRDHVVVPASHTFMLLSDEVVHQACTYLAQGKFDHASPRLVSLN